MRPEIHFTVGPASWAETTLREIVRAGATACRINLSHMRPEELPGAIERVRRVAQQLGVSLPIGVDLRGRKLRIGPLPGGAVTLRAGQRFDLIPVSVDEERPGGLDRASVNCPTLADIVQPGDQVLLDDGGLRLEVVEAAADRVICHVLAGGPLPERSGFNLPGRSLSLPPLTPKDQRDLQAAQRAGVDFVYLSYAETAQDITATREALRRHGLDVPIVAKIERAVALEHVEALARAADAICLARGDLGVEVPLPELPHVQRLVAKRAQGARALLAGEVLYSMVHRPYPSRAELTDVVTAVEQGFVGVVLSDETAMGAHPVDAVRWLRQIWEHTDS